MNNQRTLLFVFAFVISTALAAVAIAPAARAGVSTESPFAPRGFGVGAAASNSPIELRGITTDAQGMRFAIYDPAKKEGAWVRINEKGRIGEAGQSFVISSYDAATNRINIDYQGRSQTLALADPKFAPAKTVPMAIPGMAPQQMQAQPGSKADLKQQQRAQQQQAQASPAESSRLEAIRAEIARRRSQRDSSGGQ